MSLETSNVIYMDYNATTPVEKDVADVVYETLRDCWGNPSSSHTLGTRARRAIETARQQVSEMLGADAEEIVFTSGGTEANNMVLETAIEYFRAHQSRIKFVDDTVLPHIVTSNVEHDSIKLYLDRVVSEGRAEVTYVPVSHDSCRVEVQDIVRAIRPNTCLVTVMLANNETGVLQPVSEIAQGVRGTEQRLRILLHTDAAQALGKVPVSVSDLSVDFLTVVGHKFYGPRIGAVYVRGGGKLADVPVYPLLVGGGQERGMRPGTENTAMIAGLGKAAELVSRNLSRYQQNQADVRDYLETRLTEIFGDKLHVTGRKSVSTRLPNTCNISLIGSGLEGHKMLGQCTAFIASLGAACHSAQHGTSCSPVLLACGIPQPLAANAIRLSVGRETTRSCIDAVVQDLCRAHHLLVTKPEHYLAKPAEDAV